MKRIFAGAAVVLVPTVGIWFSLRPAALPEASDRLFDLDQVRVLAGEGQRPVRVNRVLIATSSVPAFLAIPGEGLGFLTLPSYSFQVVYADGASVLIDTVPDGETLRRRLPFPVEYFARNHAKQERAIQKASLIVATHEHFDHVGGTAPAPIFESVRERLLLSPKQRANRKALGEAGFSEQAIGQIPAREMGQLHRAMPGVVLIQVPPSHTPGSQLVYVTLEDGTEFLFTGDIGWQWENIRRPVTHARLTQAILGENGANSAGALKFLHELHWEHPEIHLIVAHDDIRRSRPGKAPAFGEEFE